MKQFLILAIAFILASGIKAEEEHNISFRIMQFNILQGWDSYNAAETVGEEWLARREGVVKAIQEIDPDIICVQEARKLQCSYLQAQLSQYSQLARPKDGIEANGGQRDLIMYKTNKFDLVQWREFWFSETPDMSSYSWDAGTPKLTVVAQLRSREGKPKTFWVYDTHFFPSGDSCRQICSNMIVKDLKENIGLDESTILCGDLNLNYKDTRLDTLLVYMKDAATTAPESDGPEKITYNGFRDYNLHTLDHIYGRNVTFKTYHVEGTQYKYGIRYISDHYPLYADVEIPVSWQDSATYLPQEKVQLENKWIRTPLKPCENITMSYATTSRGFAVAGDTVYVLSRSTNANNASCFLDKYNAKTGDLIEKYSLGTALQGKTYPGNDIMRDDAGNLIITNYSLTMSTVPLTLHLFNPKTGTVTLMASIKSTKGAAKMEHCAIKGDVAGGNFTVLAPISSSAKALKYVFENGVQVSETLITLSGFSPSTETKIGMSPRACFLDENHAVINSSTTHPALYELSTGTLKSALEESLLPEKSTINGFTTFSFQGKQYAIYPTTDYSNAEEGYSFKLVELSQENSLEGTELWTMPKHGLGTTNNTNSEAMSCVDVQGDSAFIYMYVPGNGIACYKMTEENITKIGATKSTENTPKIYLKNGTIFSNNILEMITIADISGKQVCKEVKTNTANLENLPQGVYIVTLQDGKTTCSQKIYKK